ncbi:MAG: hypothetical protein SGI72_01880 [Planctomycetota bacterium]|nr:hypothetical protein [Planctomycetota bacterium]
MSAPEPYPDGRRHVGWNAILLCAVVLTGLWALDSLVLHTSLLSVRRGEFPLTPLYAFFEPIWNARIVSFAVCALLVAAFAPRLVDGERTSRALFGCVLGALAIALPYALFVVRQAPSELGAQSILFGYGDFLQDAERVGNGWDFLRDYVATMPTLSLHGQHYPPGPMLYLHAWGSVFGLTPLTAGFAILVAFAAAVLVGHAALRNIVSERAARQGALLVLCAPTLLDHACSAMDAVFLLAAMCTWWTALRTFRNGAAFTIAAALGVVLYVATLMSFSALPVGLAVAIFALFQAKNDVRATLIRLVIVGASYAACAALVYFVNGFAIWECLHEAREHAAKFMGRIIRGTPHATWAYRTYGNGVAFAIGAGAALVAACAVRIESKSIGADRWTPTALLALLVMTFAPIYYMETERIWMFAVPWIATVAIGPNGVDDVSMRRLLSASLVQALVMEALLFTYW